MNERKITVALLVGLALISVSGCQSLVDQLTTTTTAIATSSTTTSTTTVTWHDRPFPTITSTTVTGTSVTGTSTTTTVTITTTILPWIEATASAGFSARNGLTVSVLNNKLWVVGGYDGSNYCRDVWSSTDGASWTLVTANAGFGRAAHASVTYDGKIWVIGGQCPTGESGGYVYANDVWSSADGATWTRVTAEAAFGKRAYHTALSYDGKMWVMGGFNGNNWLGDVWYSSDGAAWTRATAIAAFGERWFHASTVSHYNQMWVIAGGSGTVSSDTSWYSTDGISWNLGTTETLLFRNGATAADFDNNIYLMGGSASNYLGDVWSSSDGVTWTRTSSSAFPPRCQHASAFFDNKLWVIGGEGGSDFDHSENLNDVWYLPTSLPVTTTIAPY